MPSKVQANFWVDDLQVKNINVKNYESSDMGNAGVSGKFYISGTLNVQPKGYTWAMQQPFRIGMQVDEEPRSGTIVFTALSKRGIDQMVELAISDYSLDSKVVGMLGRLDYVPHKDRRRAAIDSVVKAHQEKSARMAWIPDSGPREQMEWFRTFLKNYAKWGGGRVRGKAVIDFSDSAGKATSRFDFKEWGRDYKSKKLTEHYSSDSGSGSFSIMVSEGMTPDEAVRKMSDEASGKRMV